jgi:diguanylate cyclase (GGDEF)-like protein
MFKISSTLHENSIQRLVVTSFIFVLLLPMGFFVYSLFQNSWQQVEQNILERHRLISTSLIEPFSLYINSKQLTMHVIGRDLQQAQSSNLPSRADKINPKEIHQSPQEILDKHHRTFSNVVAISYIQGSKNNLEQTVSTNKYISQKYWKLDYKDASFHPIKNSDGSSSNSDSLSAAFQSTITGEPVVLLRHQIFDDNNQVNGTLFAEILLSSITSMCSKINFDQKAHCATVDHLGQVIAHPNKEWVKKVKSLSNVSIVQAMVSGNSGTAEFYSPFLKEDMVAGFSAIPRLGWGIMIPQPKSELTNGFDDIRKSILLWLLFGVLSAAAIAWKLADEITKPIKLLMKNTSQITKTQNLFNIDKIPENSPREIKQLWLEFSSLLSGLKRSHNEVERLNKSLSKDIENATQELRKKNQKLYELSTLDCLTSLPNRRFFTNFLNKKLANHSIQSIGVIFIDVDHFKNTNDNFGHEAGDAVLIHLGQLLKNAIRQSDIAARLGGDEFVIYIDNANDLILATISETIRQAAQKNPLLIYGHSISLSLSLGTVSHLTNSNATARDFFSLADKAMYVSKGKGRNAITHYNTDNLTLSGGMAG